MEWSVQILYCKNNNDVLFIIISIFSGYANSAYACLRKRIIVRAFTVDFAPKQLRVK